MTNRYSGPPWLALLGGLCLAATPPAFAQGAAAAPQATPPAGEPSGAQPSRPLSLAEAIRATWAAHAGLKAGEAEVESLRADATAADDARLPTATFGARALRTTEPMMAFGLKLDQGRIATSDFDPALLNSPDAAYAWGLSAAVTQPLYAGGRIDAGRRAAQALAEAGQLSQERRKQELAMAVAQAYFGALTAAQGVRFAEDLLAQAKETEAFARARTAAGAMLEADAARAGAFRAQAEAGLVAAQERLSSARSALALLAGDEAEGAALATPLEAPDASISSLTAATEARPDLLAAKARARAAAEGASAADGALLPEVFLQLSAETARRKPDEGTVWTTALIGARWQLSFGALDGTRAARSRARAAEEATRWEARKARREVAESRRALLSARSRIAAAREAVSSSEAAREQRTARHRQGLLPLTEVLDAETALSGARALLLQSQLEARLALASLQLAQGLPVEGVTP
jgi:outer membrane protein TolC